VSEYYPGPNTVVTLYKAEGEADRVLAYQGIVNNSVVSSPDTDQLIYQTPRVLFKLKHDGRCQLFEAKDLPSVKLFKGLSHDQVMC